MNKYQNAGVNCAFLQCRPCRGYPTQGYPKISEAAARTCTTKQSFLKIQQNSQERTAPETIFNLLSSSSSEKRRQHIQLFASIAKYFRNTFIMESLLRTGFERRILRKVSNQHSYYNKEISSSRQLFEKTDITRESVYLRTIDRKLTLNFIVIFNPFTVCSSQ